MIEHISSTPPVNYGKNNERSQNLQGTKELTDRFKNNKRLQNEAHNTTELRALIVRAPSLSNTASSEFGFYFAAFSTPRKEKGGGRWGGMSSSPQGGVERSEQGLPPSFTPIPRTLRGRFSPTISSSFFLSFFKDWTVGESFCVVSFAIVKIV
ncbi:hypothetical protein CEXT_336261 [Caerostris extrusa]|uniref:Uncharacterized protein n=1 Tax=Caerostris extrusa TaxID=172846 RepID=A0AAV4UYG0_CAEEX|nr:hypothetical protein CEXT_336261 [Caerostris extrusa]